MQNNYTKGKLYEKFAIEYLLKKDYKILYQNYKNIYGEIDIVALLQDYIIFVEVKYRKTSKFGLPKEAVNFKKQTKIKNVALFFIEQYNITDKNFRFDVIEILDKNITHIENAFWL